MIKRFLWIIGACLLMSCTNDRSKQKVVGFEKTIVKIGEIMCYTRCTHAANDWRRGWQMALNEANQKQSNVKFEVISRDSQGEPGAAALVASELKSRDQVNIVFGTLFSHVGLAVTEQAKYQDFLFFRGVGGSLRATNEFGHDNYFQLEPPVTTWVVPMVEQAIKSGVKTWASAAPDYEFGRSVVAAFEQGMLQRYPEAKNVEQQWFPQGKIQAGSVVQALMASEAESLFISPVLSDYGSLVREGYKRKLYENKLVLAPINGFPRYIRPLGDEAPQGWHAIGYPAEQITEPKHMAFVQAFKAQHGPYPTAMALYGYMSLSILTRAILEAGSDHPQQVREVLSSQTFDSPLGAIGFRGFDGLSTMGFYYGKTGRYEGLPTIVDWQYIDATPYLPTKEDVLALRGQ